MPEPLPLTDVTNEANQQAPAENKDAKPRAPRQPKQRGPPEDGIPSTTKVMVANLPYDLSEEKVWSLHQKVQAHVLIRSVAQRTLCRLRARVCQDRPSSHSTVHGQEAPSSQ